MAFVSQSATTPRRQRDGTLLVRFTFVDAGGESYAVTRRLPAGADVAAAQAEAAATTWAKLAEYELESVIERVTNGLLRERLAAGLPVTDIATRFATPEQVRARLFQWFVTARADEARHLVPAIDAYTDAGLVNMLGIDQATVDAVRARAATLAQINTLTEAVGG